ncbi:NAD(P)-binding protein [Rhizodiscina lignyota]|uniref:Very-long-chain 3-oxoacyl-CoA reductase n=1 Tax=Rhizodiscina lignyota TaxID=1504668 RepID=A0A9P4M292_9PEZI|nr:NAD(P)-binding protein [Rhizodiscina lignyota]
MDKSGNTGSLDDYNYFTHPAFQIFTVIGLLYISTKIASFVQLVASIFVLPGTSLSKFGPKGSWVVITGASDGIGKEFALQLAQKGFNLVLVSRTASKLQDLSTEIKDKHGAESKVLAMDFSANRDKDYVALEKLIKDLDIAILINNVGLSHAIPVPFLETPHEEMTNIIMINCLATLRVTQIVAPSMVEKGRGFILTMSSFGGLLPTPLLATYSGSKAFLQQWSSALGSELAPKGVTVQCVQSYLVTSAMSKVRRSTSLIPSPKTFVRSVLGGIGQSRGAQGMAYTSTPFWTHAFMHWGLANTVGTMSTMVVNINKSLHEGIRKRALRKAERDAKKQ